MKIEKITTNCTTSFNGGFTKRAEVGIKEMLVNNYHERFACAYEDNAKLLRTIFQIKQNPKNYLIDINLVNGTKDSRLSTVKKYINIMADEYLSEGYGLGSVKMPSKYPPVTLCEYYNLGERKHCIPYVGQRQYYNNDFIKQLSTVLNKFGKDKPLTNIPELRFGHEGYMQSHKLEEKYIDFLKDLVRQRWGSKCPENNPKEKDLIEWLFK